ncbi:MDR family MFS transporter [Arthrobacter roseus]|uniref:MDR family MFS transporter n=1 Tax=Arthrobacter roseus TaxID=136274 RepID=UPI001EF9907F|nr:MDR family MFS transporter [Arthrobacter roseus]MBM7849449.1 DHA2 family lincomycin resistance protein-like MFS transporter [Arthrobacter roseus]
MNKPDHSARNKRVIWLLLVSAFVVILNETIMNVAIRELMIDLNITARAAQWLTTAFMLTMAVVIPITGFLLQRFNTRPIFIAAMSLFSTGTLLAALAPGFSFLLLGRVVQASGTAIMMPLLMTTVMTLVPPRERGKTMGNVSIVISVAPAIGPTISGIILSSLSWRWMFWLVLPIAVTMLIIGARRVENVTEPKKVPIDVASVILSALGFGGLIFGLSRVGADSASSTAPMWIALITGAVSLLVFVLRQLKLQRKDRALLDLRTFSEPIFAVSASLMVISMASLFGTVILLPIYLQQVLGLEPVQVGLLLLPGGLLMGLLAPFVGRLYDKIGPRPLVVPGTIVLSSVMWFLSTISESTEPMVILAAHMSLSVGLALLFTPLFSAGLGSLKPHLYSHGSAVVGTVQQVAGAAGTALFITIMSIQSTALASEGAVEAVAVAGGVRMAFMTGAVVSLLGIVAAFFLRKPEDPVEVSQPDVVRQVDVPTH